MKPVTIRNINALCYILKFCNRGFWTDCYVLAQCGRLYRLLTAATLWLSSGPSAPLILIKFAICNFLFGPFLFHYCKSDIFICKFNEKCSDSLKQGFFQNILWCCYCQILKLWCKITVRELRIFSFQFHFFESSISIDITIIQIFQNI